MTEFFRADVTRHVYDKENLGPDSYRVAGSPCHGGYAYEGESAAQDSGQPSEHALSTGLSNNTREKAVLKINGSIDSLIVDAILERHNGKRGLALIASHSTV